MPSDTLENRAFLAVSGAEAEDFLQGIITTDVPSIAEAEAQAGALLTPQGKIMFEFMIARSGGEFVIETDAGASAALAKRLTLYKLRAKVAIEPREGTTTALCWNEPAPAGSFKDMRFARAGVDLYRLSAASAEVPAGGYAALRIANGISGGAEDGDASDFFPHDLLMDRNGGLNFRKGCYVGQEVVSRMQHRSTARRRLVIVEAEAPLPASGTALTIGGREIGALRRVEGKGGLAVARIDKAGEAMATDTPILAGDVAVTLILPTWSGIDFPASADEAAS